MATTYAPVQSGFVAALLDADIAPYVLGALDAEKGEPCQPDVYFAFDGARAEYVEGWHTATSELEATLDAVFAPVAVDDRQLALDLFDYDAEADDYEDYLADVDYFRHGC